MKTYNAPLTLLVAFCLFSTLSISAQGVGIGTTSPRATLEVVGNMSVSGTLDIGNYNSLTDGELSTFLIQDMDDTLKTMDVSNPTGAALAYIQEYIITNPEKDWIKDFDTGIDATEFTVISISASYDRELTLSETNNAPDNATLPYTATFILNGTWHIIADFPVAANRYSSEIGTWTIQTLIFSNDLSKQFGTVTIPMSNGTTGTAASPIID